MTMAEQSPKPIVFTAHARRRMRERGASEQHVIQAIRAGRQEPAQRGLSLFRLNIEFQTDWDGKYYAVQQVAAVVAEEPHRLVVVTVYTSYF